MTLAEVIVCFLRVIHYAKDWQFLVAHTGDDLNSIRIKSCGEYVEYLIETKFLILVKIKWNPFTVRVVGQWHLLKSFDQTIWESLIHFSGFGILLEYERKQNVMSIRVS